LDYVYDVVDLVKDILFIVFVILEGYVLDIIYLILKQIYSTQWRLLKISTTIRILSSTLSSFLAHHILLLEFIGEFLSLVNLVNCLLSYV